MKKPCIVICIILVFSIDYIVARTNSTRPREDTFVKLSEVLNTTCREKKPFRSLESNRTLFRVVDVKESRMVALECKYCGEEEVHDTRVWYYQRRTMNATVEEVELGMEPVLTDNRVFTTPSNTLFIQNLTKQDGGLYWCKTTLGEETEFQFILDVISPNVRTILGNAKGWYDYSEDYIGKTNTELKKLSHPEISDLGVKVRIVSEWQPWGPCEGCAGQHTRFAKCRIKPHLNRRYKEEHSLNETHHLFLRSLAMSCHSLELETWLPHISSLITKIPDYAITEMCFAPCPILFAKKGEAKYKNFYFIPESDSKSFVCPEATVKSKVKWMKDGLELNPVDVRNEDNNPVSVDRLNVLLIHKATQSETGRYVCYIDNIPIQQIDVKVEANDLFNYEIMIEFTAMFSMVLITSLIIVIAGILVQWRRGRFKKIKFP